MTPGTLFVVLGTWKDAIGLRRSGYELRDSIAILGCKNTQIAFLFRAPLEASLTENVLRHGSGGLNISACTVGSRHRWPPNVLLVHDPECTSSGKCSLGCPVRLLGEVPSSSGPRLPCVRKNRGGFGGPMPEISTTTSSADTGFASRSYPQFASYLEVMRWLAVLLGKD